MIRVLHVTPQMDYGGVASVIRNYYSVLDHDEVVFDFVTHGGVEQYHSELISEGSEFYYFKTIGQIGFIKYIKQIKENISTSKYDIVHIHVGDLTGVYAKAFRICGVKSVINHGHGSEPVTNNRKYVSGLLRLLAKREADVCIGCGRKAGDFMFGKNNYILLPNGINYYRFTTPNVEIQKKLALMLNTIGRFVITNVGNLQPVKNQHFLIRVISDLSKDIPNIQLVVAGEGGERQSIEELIKELHLENNVVLAGVVKTIPELLSISNAFVMPSLHEGIPVSAIEAQATGIPCVFSNTIDHDIDIGNSHTWFAPIDKGTAEWAKIIKDIYDNRDKWHRDTNIQERLKEKGYDVEANADKLMSIYKTLKKKIEEGT